MENRIIYPTEVTISISSKVQSINGRWHIKWEQNLVKEVEQTTFKFTTLDLQTAMARINYMLSVHPKDYFSNITINNDR
tara:strand:- start:296 stop:532 length:237 start_codon:yes stop_codon:yes gene_type:complete